MGNGGCSRRQRRVFQVLLLGTVVCGMLYGGMVSYEMHKQLKRTEAMAVKYQQHQESLSAQLQVVYEHRSRLEKSLQKERLEHKKAKEDYLVYKLESQQSLNKEKQESNSKLNSLQVQHQMLKNEHEDLKRQYNDLQEQHQVQGEDHSRQMGQHKERFNKLQQIKEEEISQLKVSMFNLREENKQLRKAHNDIHTQLRDAQVQHQDLKVAHDQLAMTLEDHKSALAVARAQVDQYKQLKDSLIRLPQLSKPSVPHLNEAHPGDPLVQSPKEKQAQEDQVHLETDSRLDHQEERRPGGVGAVSHPTVSHNIPSEREEDGEAERKRELAEEEMAQAGQPQKLEEDPDQVQEEQLEEEEQPDENALDRQRRHPDPDAGKGPDHDAQLQQPMHGKSPYEQQQEQQRLEAQRAEELRRLQIRQQALQAQQEKFQKEREQRLKEEKEALQHREAYRKELLLKQEQLRKRAEYENLDNDIDQREENHPDEEEREEEEKLEVDHKVSPHQGGVDADVDPEDDPNNQGEDEFEEAEEEQTPRKTAEEEEEEVVGGEEEPATLQKTHPRPEHRVVEEELVMAGNPDQQEDALDDQYQEEVEDEAQEDIAGGTKRDEEEGAEEEGEDHYNEEDVEQDEAKKPRKEGNPQIGAKDEDENFEEEEDGEDKETHRRGEM